MSFLDLTRQIAAEFPSATGEPFKGHKLAELIRDEWPKAAVAGISAKALNGVVAKSSAGIGQWNRAPWLAFLHKEVTGSAREGFYPIYLFEEGFKNVCLVVAQGTDLLRESLGAREARRVLLARADQIRKADSGWMTKGFSAERFRTASNVSSGAAANTAEDPWSVSVAFGRRYRLTDQLDPARMKQDLEDLLIIHQRLVKTLGSKINGEDRGLEDLAGSDEVPLGGLDGAVKLIQHRSLEKEVRQRNVKLIRDVRKELGDACMGCGLDTVRRYEGLKKAVTEVHHITPLSEAPKQGVQLSVDDFAVLCPTCHRAIHRLGCPGLDGFRAAMQRTGASTSEPTATVPEPK